jgi:hypothetical protein
MRFPREPAAKFFGQNRIFPFATAGCCDCLQSRRDWMRSRNGKNEPGQGRRVGGGANEDLQLVSTVAAGRSPAMSVVCSRVRTLCTSVNP